MTHSASQANSDTADGRAVLANLRQLRRFRGPADAFWRHFAQNAADLCRSPFAQVLLKSSDGRWLDPRNPDPSAPAAGLEPLIRTAAEELAPRASSQGFAFAPLHLSVPSMGQPVALVVALDLGDEPGQALLALVVDRRHPQFNELIVRTQLVADVPRDYLTQRTDGERALAPVRPGAPEGSSLATEPLVEVMDLLALLQRQRRFVSAAMALVNDLAARFGCARVSLGWRRGDYVEPVAISHMERFEAKTDVCQRLEAVFEECYDQDEELLWPQSAEQGAILAAHQAYAREHRCDQVLSLPLRHEGAPLAVLTCERQERPFSELEMNALRLALDLVTPWLRDLERRDRWFGGRLALWLRERAAQWLGPERTGLKLGAVAATLALLYLVFGTWTYRVDVAATLETDQVAYLTAPFDGYIDEVMVHAGDWVSQDDLLLTLDTQELYLKESEASADVLRYAREAEKARASNAYADMQVAMARSRQAQASLERIRYFIRQASLRAPFEGVVVEGDRKQLLGAPVGKGDLLFKVAQLTGIYARLQLDERDIGEIRVGDRGTLALLSRPEHRIPLEVTEIIPVAEVNGRQGNTFILKARFPDGPEDWWRPGMSGLAKIEVGERSILWILSHRAADFLRMQLWW